MTKPSKSNSKENLKEHTYQVTRMHCSSCKLLIEKKLLDLEGVESVEASVSKSQAILFYQGKKPTIEKLNKKFRAEGYHFGETPTVTKAERPFISRRDRRFSINKDKFFRYVQTLIVSLLFIVGFLFFSRSGLASKVTVTSSSALPAFFLFGLMAGVSSCAALVGGLVLSMSKQWSEIYRPQESSWRQFQPHLLFNFGRLVSFALLGAFLGTLGAFLQISLTATSVLAIGVSVLMIFLAFQMLGVKRLQKFQVATPKFITRFVADETNFKGRSMPFALGALTFFLPCGFTVTTQGLALTSGSALQGSLIMLFFALGTLPTLTAIGFSTIKFTAKPHLSDRFLKIAGVLVLFFGLFNFNNQLNVLGWPSLNDLKLSSSATPTPENGLAPIVNGKQVLKMNALAYGYEPNEFKVKVGLPVRWEIENKGVSGCTNAIVSKGLFPGEIRIDKNLVVEEFTPESPGSYKFSCWMGMVSGVINVIDSSGNPIGPGSPSDAEPALDAPRCGCGGGCQGSCGNSTCPSAQ